MADGRSVRKRGNHAILTYAQYNSCMLTSSGLPCALLHMQPTTLQATTEEPLPSGLEQLKEWVAYRVIGKEAALGTCGTAG